MSEEIKELDMNKYLVIKRDDIKKYLGWGFKLDLRQIEETIRLNRKADGKPQNQYLVLNLEDNISTSYIWNILRIKFNGIDIVKVKDIAVALVNAILKAKEK